MLEQELELELELELEQEQEQEQEQELEQEQEQEQPHFLPRCSWLVAWVFLRRRVAAVRGLQPPLP